MSKPTGPAARYVRKHPPLTLPVEDVKRTFGQRLADRITAVVGSWPFILVQTALLILWVLFNPWDPYPFILLNLMLSFQAAYTGPIVLMSQNRQAQRDRFTAMSDYEVDARAEEEIEVILHQLTHLEHMLHELLRKPPKSPP